MKDLKIILVEDNEWDIDFMSYALKQKAIPNELEIYNHGVAALRLFEKLSAVPDIIVLDQNLPGVSGIELLQVIRKNPLLQKVPVLVMTTAERPGYMEEVLAAGASRFITKPMDLKNMGIVTDAILELTAK